MFYQPQDLINKTIVAHFGPNQSSIEGRVEYIKVNRLYGNLEVTVSYPVDKDTEEKTETFLTTLDRIKSITEIDNCSSVIGVWVK